MDKGAEEDELAEGAEEAEGAEKTDVSAIYIYCHMVRTLWE